jgi:nucleoside 2-deoxyribosyltransferase
MNSEPLLIVGEICVDFTLAEADVPAKMRLGGIVHAARGLWASGIPYAVAAICPQYLVDEAEAYLRAHGCISFTLVANILGAPNVFLISDVREVSHQGYENLLRDAKKAIPLDVGKSLEQYKNVTVFPGAFDFTHISRNLNENSIITVDIAYDVSDIEQLKKTYHRAANMVISTSSVLFETVATEDLRPLLNALQGLGTKTLLLKENRGGSRLFDLISDESWEIPATLDRTVNSVGVGDVYTAVFAGVSATEDPLSAALRGMQAATRYAQTTFPDDFRRDVQRDFKLTPNEIISLGGTNLPWHERPSEQIYLAAPDFSYIAKAEVDAAAEALQYHNFVVRRPIQENGEATRGSLPQALSSFYAKDVALLEACSVVFAVPLERDPGTLVEIGMAIALGKPVITFDPRSENNNTMVICGSYLYSDDLDECLNATFEVFSQKRKVVS